MMDDRVGFGGDASVARLTGKFCHHVALTAIGVLLIFITSPLLNVSPSSVAPCYEKYPVVDNWL